MNAPRILLTGVTGFHNRGVEALVMSIVGELGRRLPGQTIGVLTPTVHFDQLRLAERAVARLNGLDFPFNSLRARCEGVVKDWLSGPDARAEAIAWVRGSGCIVATGGDVFSSDYGSMPRHLNPLAVARKAGVRIIFLAQSIGPFKTNQESAQWSDFARDAALITLRERASYDYVTRDLGIPPERVHWTADVAFLLPKPSEVELQALWRRYGMGDGTPCLALAPSQGLNRYLGLDANRHRDVWLRVVRWAREQLRARVLLIPHVQGPASSNDDRILATEIVRAMHWDPEVVLAGADHSASEFKGLIAGCEMVVAERMHAAIAGLDSAVSTVPIGYSVKARGIMADLLSDSAERCLIPAKDFDGSDAMITRLKAVWERRDEVESLLKSALPQIRQRASQNFELLAGLLTGG